MLPLIIPEGIQTAEHFDADTAPMTRRGQQLDAADFSRPFHMGAAAGTEVRARDPHQPHRTGQRLLAAVVQLFQLLCRRIEYLDGKILPHDGIGLPLDALQIVPVYGAVEIDGDEGLLPLHVHMKTHIVIAVIPMHEAGNDMLAGMILTVPHPPGPVRYTMYSHSCRQRPVRIENRAVLPLPGVQHMHAACIALRVLRLFFRNGAPVSRLAAALGIKALRGKGHLPKGCLRREL